jgi:ADP-ribose pyrophosphatase YjhB (NUDIX family)
MNGSEPVQREYPPSPVVSAHALIFREGRVLLVKRAHPPSQGRWSVPGGAIEVGETIHGATRREVREECGIEVEVGTVIHVADNIVPDGSGRIRFHYVVIYSLARHLSGEVHPQSDALEVRWATLDDLDMLDMHPLARETVRRAFEVANVRAPE